jgi:outer membrane protein
MDKLFPCARIAGLRAASALFLLAFLAAPQSVLADTIFGVYAGAGSWQQNYSGDFRAGVTDIDVEDDLGLDDEMNNMFYLAVEHPMPFLPNVRVNYARFDIDSEATLARDIDFNDVIFPAGVELATDLDVTQGDAIVYYEVLDNIVSLDLGFGARYFDGSVELVSEFSASEAEFTAVIPMLYGRTRADLPFSGFWVGAEAMGLGYSDSNLIDANAQIGWESRFGFGAEAGWRLLTLDIDDIDDIDEAGIDISGPYMAINFHF